MARRREIRELDQRRHNRVHKAHRRDKRVNEHTLNLTTDELEVLRGLIDELAERQGGWGEDETELNSIRYKIAVIREEPLYK